MTLIVALVAALATSPSVRAQVLEDETDGPSIALGETSLFPSLRIDAVRDDNVYLTEGDEIDGTAAIVSPRLLWVADRRLLTLRGIYVGEYAQGSESVLEYADHTLGLELEASPGKRLRINGDLAYVRRHQRPGTRLTLGLGATFDEPVTFDQIELAGRTRYGADGARGNVVFGFRIRGRSYANLPVVTDGRDFVVVEPFTRFSVRVAGDTRALVELRFTDNDFDEGGFDRRDVSILGGLTFSATDRSRGELKIGATRSDYTNDRRDVRTNLIVEGAFDFALREYSRLRLVLTRELDNAAGIQIDAVGGEAVRDEARLDWRYDWSDRVSHAAFASYEAITRGCLELGDRTASAGLELSLKVRRWLEFGVSGEAGRRSGIDCDGVDEATVDALDFDATRVGGFVRARL